MAAQVGVHEAKTHLSRLLKRVQAGEEIEIVNRGGLVARLVPANTPRRRRLGLDGGVFDVPDDFNEPLPDEILRAFKE
jgi:prevent-host-death family protein